LRGRKVGMVAGHSLNKAFKLLVTICVLQVFPLHAHRLPGGSVASQRVLHRPYRRPEIHDWIIPANPSSTSNLGSPRKGFCNFAVGQPFEAFEITEGASDGCDPGVKEFIVFSRVTPPVQARRRNSFFSFLRTNSSDSARLTASDDKVQPGFIAWRKSIEPIGTAILLI